ncbi:hypothetical protein FB004_1272 [Sinorhizobium medicae]|nr:hypothetical protein FB006_13737 [Sinorhizobium medicae]TWA13820.1 hypothetical protein FB004_1272 [Sinorhizobium medicae]TWA31595.1 hypothetical protein FB009_1332 [Sinorhizobium medicae]TWA34918.1 hypothetical protein FB005_13637 [Sinorhizobium medicae]
MSRTLPALMGSCTCASPSASAPLSWRRRASSGSPEVRNSPTSPKRGNCLPVLVISGQLTRSGRRSRPRQLQQDPDQAERRAPAGAAGARRRSRPHVGASRCQPGHRRTEGVSRQGRGRHRSGGADRRGAGGMTIQHRTVDIEAAANLWKGMTSLPPGPPSALAAAETSLSDWPSATAVYSRGVVMLGRRPAHWAANAASLSTPAARTCSARGNNGPLLPKPPIKSRSPTGYFIVVHQTQFDRQAHHYAVVKARLTGELKRVMIRWT